MSKVRNELRKSIGDNKGFLVFILLMTVCRSAIADWYTVPTASMQPTIQIGDRITVNKMAYDLRLPFTDISLLQTGEPERGDILIFESDAADERLVKRVIGLPGDVVSMTGEVLSINGQPLTYRLNSDSTEAILVDEQLGDVSHVVKFDKTAHKKVSHLTAQFGPVTVPADHYLVLGDNRRNSADSRADGFVPRKELRGKAHHIAFSLDYDNYYMPRTERFAASLY